VTVQVGDAATLTPALRDLAKNVTLRTHVLSERAIAQVSRHCVDKTNANRLRDLLKAEANVVPADICRPAGARASQGFERGHCG
jgi:hypothetical protein